MIFSFLSRKSQTTKNPRGSGTPRVGTLVFLAFTLFFTQTFAGYAASENFSVVSTDETVYDIVALIVDARLDNDVTPYPGLQQQYEEISGGSLDSFDTIADRITRYSEDINEHNPLLDVKVLYFDPSTDTPADIANALENLYRSGASGRNNRLAGAIFIGDIPLPIVNKNGNKYVSIFPYTDFSDKAYIYNPETDAFERNSAVSFPNPEIWHGVIRAPEDGYNGKQKLAEYFDKNHLYYSGNPDFAEFDERLFFADLMHEEEKMNPDVYKYYARYVEEWENLTFMRFNKFWANELSNSVMADLDIAFNEEIDGVSEFVDNLENGSGINGLPDIYSKSIIENYLIPYFKVNSKYISEANDFVDGTGRYSLKGFDADLMPVLITIKDEYTRRYLRDVSEAVEEKVNLIAEQISEPLPLLEYTTLSGAFESGDSNVPFSISASSDVILDPDYPLWSDALYDQLYPLKPSVNGLKYRFHYKDGDKMYINGIDAELIQSAEQCSLFLGSTEDSYFDENLNFNPNAVDGEYSILVRALKSDSLGTIMPWRTAGVNTRLVSSEQAAEILGFDIQNLPVNLTGAVVEDNYEYGISAFIDNSIKDNPFETVLENGDVIVSVNGERLGCYNDTMIGQNICRGFDDAVTDSFESVKEVIEAFNKGRLDVTEDYNLLVKPVTLPSIDGVTPGQTLNGMDVLRQAAGSGEKIDHAVGNMSIEFYHVEESGVPTLQKENFTFTVDWDEENDQDVWTLSDEEPSGGYLEGPKIVVLLSSEGINSTTYNFGAKSDGAIFTLFDATNEGYDLSGGCNLNNTVIHDDRCFPLIATMGVLDPSGGVAVSRIEDGAGGYKLGFADFPQRSGEDRDIDDDEAERLTVYEYPEGSSLSDIDDVIYNSCYSGLPDYDKIDLDLIGKSVNMKGDIYDRLISYYEEFIDGNDDEVEHSPLKSEIDFYYDFDASDVLLNYGASGDSVTLKDFTDHFGLYDGIDNDGDEGEVNGLTDSEIRYNTDDEPYRFYDYEEAGAQYGLDPTNFDEIARKLFIRESDYVIPAAVTGFDDDIVLKVRPYSYSGNTEISSVIIHNEPTSYTIMEQIKAAGTLSMPIDNPRYVAYLDKNGETQKIIYPNLFEIANTDQLDVRLTEIADKMALSSGSYRIFGDDVNAGDYSLLQIRDKILNELKAVIRGGADYPNDGYDLVTANGNKVADSLEWQAYSIDDKHQYVFEKYLNEEENAYVADNLGGYEAAYLVLDGEGDYYDTRFNKDVPEDGDIRFDEFYGVVSGGSGIPGVEDDGNENEEDDGNGNESVSLPQFIPEVTQFMSDLSAFANAPGISLQCSYGEGTYDEVEEGEIDIITYSRIDLDGFTEFGEEDDPEAIEELLWQVDDSLKADNEARMKVVALGEDGEVEFSLVSSAEGIDVNDMVSFENENRASFVDGKAEVYLKAGEIAGPVLLKAEKVGSPGVFGQKELYLTPGDPAQIKIEADSSVLVNNNESQTRVYITLLDKFGNEVIDSFDKFTVFADPKVEIAEGSDFDPQLFGVQMAVNEGKGSFYLNSKDEIGVANLVVVLMDYELSERLYDLNGVWEDLLGLNEAASGSEHVVVGTKTFEVIDENDLDLNFSFFNSEREKVLGQTPQITANGEDLLMIKSELMRDGEILEEYNGPINIEILNGHLLQLISVGNGLRMQKGQLNEFNARLKANTVSGEAEILIEIPGFISKNAKIKLLAGDPYKIQLGTIGDDFLQANSNEEVILEARILDKYGNLVERANGFAVNFAATEDTKGMVEFTGDERSFSLNGVAGTTIKGGRLSGKANLFAFADNGEIIEGLFSLDVKKRILSSDVMNFKPKALYISLLGGSFGDISADNNIASALLFNGKTQAVSTTTANPNGNKRLISIDANGEYEILDENIVELIVPPTSDFPYEKIIFSDSLHKVEIASMFKTQGVDGGVDGGVEFANDVFFDVGENVSVPGVYVNMETSSNRYDGIRTFTGSSSANPLGIYIVDRENDIVADQAPGFAQISLEDVEANFGLGFEGKNKHMLYFAAGNSVGESHIPYASEVGIIYGDPLIRLAVDQNQVDSNLGFTTDVGKPIFASDKPITELVAFDYNGDGYKDLLLIYEDGRVRLLLNEFSNERFVDAGEILNIYGGIYSSARIDVNGDNFDDLIVGTKESCNVDENCVSLFTNVNGNLKRETLDLGIDGKIFQAASYDMNNDGCEDLITSDSGANIKLFYNNKVSGICNGLRKTPGLDENFGFSIDSDVNSLSNLFIYYPGMTSAEDFITLNLPSASAPASEPGSALSGDYDPAEIASSFDALETTFDDPNIAESNVPERQYPADYDFVSILNDSRLGVYSTKTMIDENGGTVSMGDKINILISLENRSDSGVNDLMLSDLTPATMSLIDESLECLDADCSDNLEWLETEMSLRSHVIEGISVPAGGKRTIKYSMIVEMIPKVNFELGEAPIGGDSGYMDIWVMPEYNPYGGVIYLYSNGAVNGEVKYERGIATPEEEENNSFNELAEDGLGFQEVLNSLSEQLADGDEQAIETMMNAFPKDLRERVEKIQAAQSADSNFDGCVDSWGGGTNSGGSGPDSVANDIANQIQTATTLLRCSGGGCLPSPYNYAFLAPDQQTPGISAFGLVSYPPFALPFSPSQSDSYFRFYVSPTLTMGVGMAACLGTGSGHSSPCYAFALPVQSIGACDAIVGSLTSSIASASGSSSSPDLGMTTVVNDGSESLGSDAISGDFSFNDPSSPLTAAGATNIRIPGFPSVITNWMDAQFDEVFNKLLDLPDFYFIYPDVNTLVSEHAIASANFGQIQSLNDFMRALNSLPIIRIEGKEVVLKIPAIPASEIEKFNRQAEAWVKYHEEQLRKVRDFWQCDISEDRKTLCDKVTFKLDSLIRAIQKLTEALDRISNLPRDILNYRTLESKYATQIICYLDTIMETIGGYIKRQQKRIEAWMQAVEDVIRTFKGWQAILNVAIEYQKSCDSCQSDRFSKLGLLLQIFAVIPDLPIIPIPKMPDIVFDISQIQTGVEIVWPDLVFKPEPLKLPQLPTITLPDVLPDVTIEIPIELENFVIPDWLENFPTFEMPNFPDLPPLPVPQLPDLPRPPKIPKIPNVVIDLAANLKQIFKILCLLKQALIPVPELGLATEIETLTQPSVQITLPIISKFAIQMPAIQYDYVEQIKFEAKMSFRIQTDFIYQAIKASADISNQVLENAMRQMNDYFALPFKTLQEVLNNASRQLEGQLGEVIADIEEEVKGEEKEEELVLEDLEVEFSGIVDEVALLEEDLADLTLAEEDFERLANLLKETNDLIGEANSEADKVAEAIDNGWEYELITLQGFIEQLKEILAEINDILVEYSENAYINDEYLEDLFDINETVAIVEEMEKYVEELESVEIPERYYLVAEERFLDENSPELNRSLAEIEYKIAFEDLPVNEEMGALAEMRDSLIAYTKNLEDSNALLQDMSDYDSFVKMVAESDQSVRSIASTNNYIDLTDIEQTSFSLFDEEVLIASLPDEKYNDYGDVRDNLAGSTGEEVPLPSTAPGMTIYTDGGAATILSYTKELGNNVKVLNLDVDQDSDVDVIYSMGGDVYLKENHTLTPVYGNGDILSTVFSNDLNDYVSKNGASTQGITSPYENHETVDISWEASRDSDVIAYEVWIQDSLLTDKYQYRYLALVEAVDSEMSVALIDELDVEEEFIKEIKNKENPRISLEIDNGTYYATVYSISVDGERSIASDNIVIAPSQCADKEAPLPAVSDTEYEISLYQELEIDARGSFDVSGEIVEYRLENVDSGEIIYADIENPVFEIPTFKKKADLGEHEYVLHVVDQSGNSSELELFVNVFVPKITLDNTFARTLIASGQTEPAVGGLPFSIFRKSFVYRSLEGELYLAPRYENESIGEYETENDGSYNVSEFDVEDMIVVENSDGVIVAEVNTETGNVMIVESGYSVEIHEAKPPYAATRIDIVDLTGSVLGSIYFVADPNQDVKIYQENESEEFYAIGAPGGSSLAGVNVRQVSDNFEIELLPSDNSDYPGGARLIYNGTTPGVVGTTGGEIVAIIESSGNIVLLDDERMSLSQKENDVETDPFVIEMRFKGEVVAEVIISPIYDFEDVDVVGENNLPYASPRNPTGGSLYSSLGDEEIGGDLFSSIDFEGDDELEDVFRTLLEFDVIDENIGANSGNLEDGFDLNEKITRADFVVVLLKMLCIVPREEAYLEYNEAEGYYDIDYNQGNFDYYYPYIKEASLLGLVQGYLGEADASGKTPFKPEATISRAEAVSIILETLEYKKVITLDSVQVSDPWYKEFLIAAMDLNAVTVKDGVLQNNFIVTIEEASLPDKELRYRDMFLMANRVIEFYSCFDDDNDRDGMSDYCEEINDIDDPEADPDNDSATNIQECYYGLDPNNNDSDGGGVYDGYEIAAGTDPSLAGDDPQDDDNDGISTMAEVLIYKTDPYDPDTDDGGVSDGVEILENYTNPLDGNDDFDFSREKSDGDPGIYVVPADCNSCPCISTFLHKSQVHSGDTFYSAILDEDGNEVSQSNEVKIE